MIAIYIVYVNFFDLFKFNRVFIVVKVNKITTNLFNNFQKNWNYQKVVSHYLEH